MFSKARYGFFSLLVLACSVQASTAEFNREQALVNSQEVVGRTLSGLNFQDSLGNEVSLEQFAGRPVIISLIYTSCHHICPTTTQNLKIAVAKAREVFGSDAFSVLTVGFDTANDTPVRMAEFRKRTGVSDTNWHFLSGSEGEVRKLVEQIGFVYFASPRGFDHLLQSTIVTAQGQIYRQLYGMIFPTPEVLEPLKQLIFGNPSTESVFDYLNGRIRLFCTVYDPATDNYYIDYSVFIGTFVGMMVSIVFGIVLAKEWRRSNGTKW
ncbi:MAG: protein SCO1/2 [Halieaceae bacterium]|jgi:protein SCO1/2